VRSNPVLTLVSLLIATALPCAAAAQEGPIDTDRPGITDTPTIVGPGRIQFETGWLYFPTDGTHSVAPNQLRIGALPWMEVRVGLPGYLALDEPVHLNGWVDGNVALRFKLRESSGPGTGPAVQVTIGTTIPSGSDAFRVHAIQPFAEVVAGWPLATRTNLNTMVLVANLDDGEDRWTQVLGSAALYRTLSDRFSGFIEAAINAETGNGRDDVTPIVGAGLVFLATRTLQLDVNGGFGLQGGVTDSYFGGGLGVRF